MTMTRTLPIRLAPIPGEALDSWLEALARRAYSGFGDLLAALGLPNADQTGAGRWITQLTLPQLTAISDATETTPDRLRSTTLDWYSGRALHVNPLTGTTTRHFPWGRIRGSRFCPACLEESGGRWQLHWRLELSFACTVHDRLLADTCPKCHQPLRVRPYIGQAIPQPGLCANPATGAIGKSAPRCHADLRDTETLVLPGGHPVIQAQETVNRLISRAPETLGLYRQWPQPEIKILADIRAIATRALAYGAAADIEELIPKNLFTQYHAATNDSEPSARRSRQNTRAALAAGAKAPTVAAGILIALNTLSAEDVNTAGRQLRWLITTTRSKGKSVSATNVGWCRGTSAVLTGIQLAALGPMLKPSDQLRYRIGAPLPARPIQHRANTSPVAARLPTMLWPAWSLPLSIPSRSQPELRPALSIAVLLVNSRYSLAEAAQLLHSPISAFAVSYVLQGLHAESSWSGILTALTRMADYLRWNEPPIDYRRRRLLDYTDLLPDREWARISRDTATPGEHTARARIARRYLFETLSGLPAKSGPFPPDSYGTTSKVADFPRYLTTELAAELHGYAREFLSSKGVEGEPLQWIPPNALLKDLRLPGPDPDAVPIPELHQRLKAKIRLGELAASMYTTLDTVRYLLQTQPAPDSIAVNNSTNGTKRRRAGAFRHAKKMLPRDRLLELYQRQGQSLREIAASVGVSKQTVARLAADYQLPLREPGRATQYIYDRDWLYEQYINQSRPLPAIAMEAGVSTGTVARWARAEAIPMRGRGGHSRDDARAAPSASIDAPELIRPALQGAGGLAQLRRFALAACFPTLTAAAAELGTSRGVLSGQIGNLERELGTQLLVRAHRHHPMRVTDAGNEVIKALNSYLHANQEDQPPG